MITRELKLRISVAYDIGYVRIHVSENSKMNAMDVDLRNCGPRADTGNENSTNSYSPQFLFCL